MGILDGTGLKKLQEHLLSKGDQNKITGLKLGRVLIVAKDIQARTKNEQLKNLISWVEDQQMVIGGRSRKEFAEAIKHMIPEESKTFGEKK